MAHKYWIVEGETTMELSERVTRSLEDGWELWGNPFVTKIYGIINQIGIMNKYCQAVVRFDPSGHSVIGKVETAGYSVQVPETPAEDHLQEWFRRTFGPDEPVVKVPTPQEFEYKPVVKIVQSFMGRFCTCKKRGGDNPGCLFHHPAYCSCLEHVGDDPKCRLHGGGLDS